MTEAAKPDLKNGVSLDSLLGGGIIVGEVDGEDVILARQGDELVAVGGITMHCWRTG